MSISCEHKAARSGMFSDNATGDRNEKAGMHMRTQLSQEHFSDGPLNRKARELYQRAVRWRDLNPATWNEWKAEVAQSVEEGRLWFIKVLAERDRHSGHVNAAGDDFTINNDLLPALARIMCEEVASAEALTRLRATVFERAAVERREA